MTSTERVLVDRDGGVVTVTLNRPHRKNAVPTAMWDELADTFRAITDRRSDRVVVLTGAGGDFCSGAEADRIGLVNRVVDEADLDDFVAQWATRLASGPPIALAQTKRLLHESFETTLPQALEREGAAQTINFTTADTKEAVAAFIERRDPEFHGR